MPTDYQSPFRSVELYYEIGSRHALLARRDGFAEFFQQFEFSVGTAPEAFTDLAS